MSYIRGLGNPEGLYIYSTLHGNVNIIGEDLPHDLTIPTHIFQKVMTQFWSGVEDIKYMGARFRLSRSKKFPFGKWVLRYNKWPKGARVVAWEVTWSYIAHVAVTYGTRNAN